MMRDEEGRRSGKEGNGRRMGEATNRHPNLDSGKSLLIRCAVVDKESL